MNRKRNKKTIARFGPICLLGFLLVLGGCRSTRDTAGERSESLKAEEAFFYALRDQSFQYQTLSARLQFNLVMEGKELSSRGQLKIEKNNRLQISIQPILGIEMFRIELTPDSVKILDRMNKRYLVENYTELKGDAGIAFNFYNLQALFTNQLFLPGEMTLPPHAFTHFRWEKLNNGYQLHTKDKNGLQYLFSADQDEKLHAARITDNADHTLQWNYANFRMVDNQYFPMKMDGTLFTKKNAANSLALNYSRVEINTPLQLKFAIPSGYERVTLAQLLKLLERQ